MCACCWTDCRLVHDKVFDFRGDMHSFSMFFIWMETLHVTYWVTVTYVTGCRCGFQLDQSWGPIAVERQISKARQEELGTTSWASWDTDTQLTATWPVGILKADDLWICQFSNHHSSNKMVSSKMSRSSTQIIVTCNDLHDIFSCLIGTLPISFCFGDYAVGARSEYSYQQETHPKKRLLPPDVWRIWPKWHFVVQLFSVLRRCPPRSPRSPMPILKPQLGRDVEEFTWDRSKPIFCN